MSNLAWSDYLPIDYRVELYSHTTPVVWAWAQDFQDSIVDQIGHLEQDSSAALSSIM